MSRRLAACALSGVALLLLVSVALPMAMADHAYSHRYVIFGRVVDANGDPVQGLTANLGSTDRFFRPENPCRDATGSDLGTDAYGPTVYDPVTDEHGDFMFCFHVHTMNRIEPGSGIIRVDEVPGFSGVEVRFDPVLRTQFVLVTLPEPHANANTQAVETAYTVIGRLWREASGSDQTVESIKVFGDTIKQEPVDIRLLDPQGNPIANATTVTNDYGDFAVRVPTEGRFSEGSVVIAAAGRNFTQAAAPAGVSAFAAEYEPTQSKTLQNALLIGAGIIGAGVVIGGAYYGIQKMSERREQDQVRSQSTRKRARK